MTTHSRRRPRARIGGFAAALVLGVGGLLLAGAPALADGNGDSNGGVGISVQVSGPTGTASPTPAPSAAPREGDGGGNSSGHDDGGSGSNTGNGQGGSNGNGNGIGTGKTAGTGNAPQDDGPLNISGLRADYTPSLNPGGGWVVAWFTVHNGSRSPIASRVRFWLTGPVGNTVTDPGTVALPAIAPGKTVVVRQLLGSVGQWTVLTAHATYFPPKSVDGITLKTLARDVTIFAFPWLNTVGVVLTALGVSIAAVAKPSLFGFFLRGVIRP